MSLLSRTKGKVFERAIAADLRKALPRATVHRSSQADRAYEADVVITGDAPSVARQLWLELTDSRAPSPLDKLAQAERDTMMALYEVGRPRLPVVVWHKTGARTVQATMRLETLLALYVGSVAMRGLVGTPVTIDWQHLLECLERHGRSAGGVE